MEWPRYVLQLPPESELAALAIGMPQAGFAIEAALLIVIVPVTSG
jgi:hypothetical protein